MLLYITSTAVHCVAKTLTPCLLKEFWFICHAVLLHDHITMMSWCKCMMYLTYIQVSATNYHGKL